MTDDARRRAERSADSLLTCLSEFITHDGEWDTREDAIEYLLHYRDRNVADAVAQAVKERDRDIWALRGALGYPVPGEYDGRLSDGTIPQCGLCGGRENTIAQQAEEIARLRVTIAEVQQQRGVDVTMARGARDFQQERAVVAETEVARLRAALQDIAVNSDDHHAAVRMAREALRAGGESK